MSVPEQIGIFSRQSGDWERISPPSVKVTGVWQPAKKVFVKDGGVWRPVYVSPENEISVGDQSVVALDVTAAPWDTYARYRLKADGDAQRETESISGGLSTVSILDQWKQFQYGRDFECKWQAVSGSAVLTAPFSEDTWTAISVDRQWSINNTSVGNATKTFDIFIREVGGSEPNGLDSGRIRLEAENGTL